MNKILEVLVLDDEMDDRPWFYDTFTGCNITSTSEPGHITEILKTFDYDIVFLDGYLGEGQRHGGKDVTFTLMKLKIALDTTFVIHAEDPFLQELMSSHLEKHHSKFYVIPYPELIKMKREYFKLFEDGEKED
jgi:hypothetical protein